MIHNLTNKLKKISKLSGANVPSYLPLFLNKHLRSNSNNACHTINQSLFQCHISSFLLGFIPIIANLIQLPAPILILIRGCITICFLFVIAKLTYSPLKIQSKKELPVLLISSILLSAHWLTYFYSIQVSTVTIAMLSFFTFPLITILLEPFFFKGKVQILDIFFSCFILIGLLFVIPEFSWHNAMTRGFLSGLFSALLYALRNLFSKNYVRQYNSIYLVFWQFFIGTALLLPILFIFQDWTLSQNDFFYLIILGTLITGIGHILYIQSLGSLRAGTAGVISNLEPVYGIIWGLLILHETPNWRALFGVLIILSFVGWKTFKHSR